MKLDGKFVIATNGKEVCGQAFHDDSTLTKLLERYAVEKNVLVIVEIDKEVAGICAASEDGAMSQK